MNLSAYAASADSVWLDFDFIWEYNVYSAEDIGPDTWQITANSDILQKGTEDQLYTYSNTGSSDYGYTPSTNSSYWKHYHLLIPVSDRTSSTSVTFQATIGWGESNPAIDNVTVTGKNIPPAELYLTPKPRTMNFGTATPNSPDTLYATINSVGAPGTKLGISAISIVGSSAYSIIAGSAKVGDSIPQGSSEKIGIQFLPFTSGTLTATLGVATNGADSGTQTEALTGVGAVPGVSYNGTTVLFRGTAVQLGKTAGPKYIYVTSNGVGPLNFKSFNFVGLNANNNIILATIKMIEACHRNAEWNCFDFSDFQVDSLCLRKAGDFRIPAELRG